MPEHLDLRLSILHRRILPCILLSVFVALASTQTHAFTISVGGQAYQISTLSTTFTNYRTTLRNEDWWGNPALARDFAEAYAQEVRPRTFFAYSESFGSTTFTSNVGAAFSFPDGSGRASTTSESWETTLNWATATEIPEINGSAAGRLATIFGALYLGVMAMRRRAGLPFRPRAA